MISTTGELRVKMCWPCIFASLLVLVFSLGALWLGADTGYRRWTIFHGVIGISGFVLFFIAGLSILLPALFRYPVIIGNEWGVRFRTSLFMNGRVPWTLTTGVRAVSGTYAQYVVIDLLDINGFIKTQPFWFKPLLRYSARIGWPVCMVLVDCRRSSTAHKEVAASLRKLRDKAILAAQPTAPGDALPAMPAGALRPSASGRP